MGVKNDSLFYLCFSLEIGLYLLNPTVPAKIGFYIIFKQQETPKDTNNTISV